MKTKQNYKISGELLERDDEDAGIRYCPLFTAFSSSLYIHTSCLELLHVSFIILSFRAFNNGNFSRGLRGAPRLENQRRGRLLMFRVAHQP